MKSIHYNIRVSHVIWRHSYNQFASFLGLHITTRALLLNMKQFNGKHGCCYCYQEGAVRPGCALHRFWPPDAASVRTHQSVIESAIEATSTRTPVVMYIKACVLLIMQLAIYRSMVLKVQVFFACTHHLTWHLVAPLTTYTHFT